MLDLGARWEQAQWHARRQLAWGLTRLAGIVFDGGYRQALSVDDTVTGERLLWVEVVGDVYGGGIDCTTDTLAAVHPDLRLTWWDHFGPVGYMPVRDDVDA